MPGPGQAQGGPGMPDPINALQNLASQGSRNPMMNMGPQPGQMGGPQQAAPATNLLQTLNRGPGQQMMMPGNMPGNMPGGLERQNMGMPPNGGAMSANQIGSQMANQIRLQQMQNSGMNQIPNQLTGHVTGQLQNQGQMCGQMGGQLPGQMQIGNTMANQIQNQMMGGMSQLSQQQKSQAMIMNQNFPRQPTPGQMFNQSPSPSVQSPAGLGGNQAPVASPALASSPGSQMGMMGAAAAAGGSVPPRSVGMAPSPGSSLNTPVQPNQSPMGGGAMTDEQAYREKVRQLSKYIEPLRKMITKMGNEDVEKMSKMKKLLEILTNPQQRMPLDTLIKCEIVLEKIDFKRNDSSVPAASTHQLPFKEPHVFHSLLDAVTANLQSPVINHTLHRTFGPTLEALFGPEIKLVPPLKKRKLEEPTSDIPDVLQGEIARLDQRFKVSLDPNQQPGSKSIQLICWLDDKHLPCVPPVSLIVPEDYPKTSPICRMAAQEYNATQFLSKVRDALQARIKKLPRHFSVSHLLDTWEMSVRQASAPTNTPVSSQILLMGL